VMPASCFGGVSCHRPRHAGLLSNHWVGRFIRRRCFPLPSHKSGEECAWTRVRFWLPHRCGGRTRRRFARGSVLRLIRPDVFRSVAMMTAPFAGPPALPFNTVEGAVQASTVPPPASTINDELAKLPRPRKHYQVRTVFPIVVASARNP
jgi:hypothetical protein